MDNQISPQTTPQPTTNQTVSPSTPPISQVQPAQPKSKIPKPALIGGIIFVILAILAGVAFAFKDNFPGLAQKPSPTPAPQAIAPSPTPDPTAGWTTYNSESFNDTFPVFEIKYPSSWTPDEISQGTPLILSFITNKNSSETAQVKAPIQIQVQIGENPECPCEKVTIGNLQANKIPNDSWEIIGFVSKGYSYEFMRSLKPIVNQDVSITEDESKIIFDQILSTFKFIDSQTLDTSTWKTYSNANISVKHPVDWKLETSDYLKSGFQLTNPTGTLRIKVSEGQYPYGFSGQIEEPKKQTLKIIANGQTYEATEFLTQNNAYVDVDTKSTLKYHILFGTGYPAGDDTKKSVQTIKKKKIQFYKFFQL